MATYDITWTITEEVDDDDFSTEEEKMVAAITKTFCNLKECGNDWIWRIVNQKTKQEFQIDFGFVTDDQGPEITQIVL